MLRRLLLSLTLLLALAGCRETGTTEAVRTIRVWCHQGQEAENRAMRAIAARFNEMHAEEGLRVEITFFPDFQYTEKLAIAAAGRDLPDAFDLDGPLVARLATAGLLGPLDPWFSKEELSDFLPTLLTQGTVNQRLVALGAFESAVVLYYDRAVLEQAGVSPPPDGSSWTWEQFLAACARLQSAGIEPVAMHMDDAADEWYTYAFSPVIWSGGGALIDADEDSIRGVLASPANVHSLTLWQQTFTRGFAATDPVEPDPFGRGLTAMDWSGHWMARSHAAAKGDRLGVMPLPRIGEQSVAPSGSWCWALSSSTKDPELAATWIRWVTDTGHGVIPIVRANGAVPGRRSAFAAFPEYSGNPYRLFRHQLETIARPRPRTPYYATLTQNVAAALREIARGADVATRLRMAEDQVQAVIDRRADRRAQP